MAHLSSRLCGLLAATLLLPTLAVAGKVELDGQTFTLAEGLTIELAAAPPLTKRPICVDFDPAGHLYIAESSGSNKPVQVQVKERPHSILRLTDSDGDGVFDKRTVFADNLMFPEGCTWFDGSLYVAAPPEIWKFTDTDGDGVADERHVWFDGKTLTGCANDLHGPYVAPNGLIYWCKGAFAKQTYARPNGEPFVTRAAHLFRHDPRQGFVEPVITGGMDNPVGLTFTKSGEPILACTFIHNPRVGLRDGLLHAVYGGLFGKKHGVLAGHPRTGDLMPPLVQMGATAMCGITTIKSDDWNDKDVLLACSFNLHRVSRHVLTPQGASFAATTENWLTSDDIDFHPTDVIEDADGSILVVNTGGWYKLCCPTSQLRKPDVTGAIYRVRIAGREAPDDPRGRKLEWQSATDEQLIARLDDDRFVVRRRAMTTLADRPESLAALSRELADPSSDLATTMALRTLDRLDSAEARHDIREALSGLSGIPLQVAIRSLGVWRNAKAAATIRSFLDDSNPHVARLAAAALGRIGKAESVPALLDCAARGASDRFLFHAATFALIEIAAPEPTRQGLASEHPATIRAALLALNQMPGSNIAAADVLPLLDNPEVREAALRIAVEHPEWGGAIADYLAGRLHAEAITNPEDLVTLAATVARKPEVAALLAATIRSSKREQARLLALRAIARAGSKTLPAAWSRAIATVLQDAPSPQVLQTAVTAANSVKTLPSSAKELRDALLAIATATDVVAPLRLQALRPVSPKRELDGVAFAFLSEQLTDGDAMGDRLLAADILFAAKLTAPQTRRLAGQLADLGPMELNRVLLAFSESSDEETGRRLVATLSDTDAVSAVPLGRLERAFAKFGEDVHKLATPLFQRESKSPAQRATALEKRLQALGQGNPRVGQELFHSGDAACSTCHSIGYGGGHIGPDLTNIGDIRTKRDLLESILFPSASFVRSYEPITIVTSEGQVHSGVIKRQNASEITLVKAADKSVTIPRDQIEVIQPSKVSIMPEGLDKQLTDQQLADLIAFLKAAD